MEFRFTGKSLFQNFYFCYLTHESPAQQLSFSSESHLQPLCYPRMTITGCKLIIFRFSFWKSLNKLSITWHQLLFSSFQPQNCIGVAKNTYLLCRQLLWLLNWCNFQLVDWKLGSSAAVGPSFIITGDISFK